MTSDIPSSPSLAALTRVQLTTRLVDFIANERLCLVDFLLHLAELDRRSLHLALGYPSLFAYCTGALRLTNASAWRRTTSARLLTRFPAAADFLKDGRLCLSTFVLLKEVLEPSNHLELLDRAAGRTEDEVRDLVATLRPRPEVKESIRRLTSGPEVGRTPAASSLCLPPEDPRGLREAEARGCQCTSTRSPRIAAGQGLGRSAAVHFRAGSRGAPPRPRALHPGRSPSGGMGTRWRLLLLHR